VAVFRKGERRKKKKLNTALEYPKILYDEKPVLGGKKEISGEGGISEVLKGKDSQSVQRATDRKNATMENIISKKKI